MNNPEELDQKNVYFKEVEMKPEYSVKHFLVDVEQSVPKSYKADEAEGEAPKLQPKLKFAFGYKCWGETRMNARYTADGRVAWNTGSLGVVHNIIENTQVIFRKHDQEIVTYEMHFNVTIFLIF